jgi:hypothetical protein
MMTQDKNQSGDFETVGETLGGMAGKMAGRMTDAAMNVAGSVMGSVFQAMGEWWSTPEAQQASQSFGEQEERAAREHFQSRTNASASTGTSTEYEKAKPAYQFGHVARQNPAYQGKQFDEVEAELQSAWERAAREGFGDWSQVREHARHGYTYRTPGAPNPS